MVRMKNKQNVQRALQCRVRPVSWLRGAKKHVQKIARIAEFIVRIDERHAEGMAVRERRNRRNFSDEAVGLLSARLSAEDIFRVVIESGKSSDRRDHHAHWMGVVMKTVQKFLDSFMDERVVRDVVGPIFQLRGRRQFAMQEQIRRFEVSAFLSEIFYRVAAIAQDASVAVNVCDLADARGGV